MKILCLLPDFVLPEASGLRVRALSQLRVLSGVDFVESITLLSLSEVPVPRARLEELERMLPKVRAEPPIVRQTHVRHDAGALFRFVRHRFLDNEPYLIAVNDVPEMHRLVQQHVRSRRYGAVYIGYLGMMAYLSDALEGASGMRVFLEQHNLEWQIFDRLAKTTRPPMRQLIAYEAAALMRFERKALRAVDSVIAISATDASEFRSLSGIEAVVIPPFVKPRPERQEESTGPALGYIGHLAWQPNVQGLDWFCEHVWPLVRQRIPDATLALAGPGLGTDASGALVAPPAWQRPGISVVGFVDDLNQFYRTKTAMIAPVIGGSGVRMKLLETLSAGMPTVTTRDGAAGLLVEHERELFVADDPERFCEGIGRLLSDPALRKRLRSAGYAYLGAHHSEESARRQFERVLTHPPRSFAPRAMPQS